MRRLSADETFAVAVIGAVAIFAQLGSIPCNDIWWHLATGRIIATTHAIPTIEPFSYTREGAPYFNQPWIAQLFFYAVYRVGGAPLLLAQHALCIATTYALVCRLAWRRSNEPRFAAWGLLVVSVALGIDNWAVRPQTLAMPLFAVMLGLVSDTFGFAGTSPRRDRLKWLPPMMLLWVNMHGSFVLGLLVPAAAFGGHVAQRLAAKRFPAAIAPPPDVPVRRTCAVLAATALATLVNPRGPAIYPYVKNMMSARAMVELNLESAPTTPFFATGAMFFGVAGALVVLLVLARKQTTLRPTWSELAVVAFAFVQGMMVRRAILWFALVATPLIVVLVTARVRAARPRRPEAARPASPVPVPLVVIGFLVVLTSPWLKPRLPLGESARLLEDITPVTAVERLNAEPRRPARLFNDLQFGSYLQFAAPEQKVFVDTRMDFYPYDLFREYIRLSAGEDIDALVEKWSIDAMLLEKTSQEPLVDKLRKNPAWEIRFEDAHAILLFRKTPTD